MNLPNLFKSKNTTPSQAPSQWDSLQNAPQYSPNNSEQLQNPQIAPNRRQQKKIEAALLTGDKNYLAATEDIQIDSSVEENFLDKLANGEITKDQERDILYTIKPFGREELANQNTLKIASNTHETKIMNWAFNMANQHADRFSSDTAKNFLESFPTPIDFEKREQEILTAIERHNSPQKLEEYKRDMDAFKRHMYGKRQEYYKQLQYLHEAAEDYASQEKDEIVDAFTGQRIKDTVANNYENREVIKLKSCSVREKSKAEVSGNLENAPSQDASYQKDNVFAVFDGVGGHNGGEKASSACKASLPNILENVDFSTQDGKRQVIAELDRSITEGASTCVVAKIIGDELHYAAIGDSRLYVITKDGYAQQITMDDNFTPDMLPSYIPEADRQHYLDHGISRSLGAGNRAPSERNLGSVRINKGDRIVLCSDGITGDTARDSISTSALGAIVSNSATTNEAADNLMKSAIKIDDRTVIVAEVA